MQTLGQILAHLGKRPPDRRAKTLGASTAVAFYHNPLQTDKAGAIVPRRAQLATQTAEHGQRQQTDQPSRDPGTEQRLQAHGNHRSQTLAGLEHDIADEAVAHHHVRLAAIETITLRRRSMSSATRGLATP